jgi:hypothetical protein
LGRTTQPVNVPSAQEDRGVVQTGHEPADRAQYRKHRHNDGKRLLKLGQVKAVANFDPLTIPEKLVPRIKAKLVQVLDSDRCDIGRPAVWGGLSHRAQPSVLFRNLKPSFNPGQPLANRLDHVCQAFQFGLHLLDRLDGQQDFARPRARHGLTGSGAAAALSERIAPLRRSGFHATSR